MGNSKQKYDIRQAPSSHNKLIGCLQEFDSKGNQVGPDYDAWSSNIFFDCKDIEYISDVSKSYSYNIDKKSSKKGSLWNSPEVQESEFEQHRKVFNSLSVDDSPKIYAELEVAKKNSINRSTLPKLSMLGTDRCVERISLEILRDNREFSSISGSPKSDIIEEDTIWITLLLDEEKYDEIASLIKNNILSSLRLSLSAHGFYAQETYDMPTDMIKVLSDDRELQFVKSSKKYKEPFRLGHIADYSLYYGVYHGEKGNLQSQFRSDNNGDFLASLITDEEDSPYDDEQELIDSVLFSSAHKALNYANYTEELRQQVDGSNLSDDAKAMLHVLMETQAYNIIHNNKSIQTNVAQIEKLEELRIAQSNGNTILILILLFFIIATIGIVFTLFGLRAW